MFQIVVGSRQVRNVIAVEQPAEVAAGNFEEVAHDIGEFPFARSMTADRPQQAGEFAADLLPRQLGFILQQVCRLMHPPIALFDVVPSVRG